MTPKTIMRVSDMKTAIDDYIAGYYSDEEFQIKIVELADEVSQEIIIEISKQKAKEIVGKWHKEFIEAMEK